MRVSPLRTAAGAVLAAVLVAGLAPSPAAHPGHDADPEFRALLVTDTDTVIAALRG